MITIENYPFLEEELRAIEKMNAVEPIEKALYTLIEAVQPQCKVAHDEYGKCGFVSKDEMDIPARRLSFTTVKGFCEGWELEIKDEQVDLLESALWAWCRNYRMMALHMEEDEILYPESLLLAWMAGSLPLAGLVVRDDYKVRSKKTRSR